MKTIIKSALVALALTVGTAAAQAHTPRHFPYKNARYAVSHTYSQGEFKVGGQSDCRRTVIIRGSGKGPRELFCPVL
jgi:hypothetical protein